MAQQPPIQRNSQDYSLMALATLKAEGKPWAVLTTEDITSTLGLTKVQAARLFSRLVAKHRIQQLRRGLYLAPSQLPPGKIWAPSSYDAIWAYMNWLGAIWQITGYAAFTRYRFSTQIVQRITVFNNKISGEVNCGGSRVLFFRVPELYLGFITEFPMQSGITISFSSKTRTIFDAVSETKRFAALPEAYSWFRQILDAPEDIVELKKICLKIGDRQTTARIGFIIEYLGVDASDLLSRIKDSTTLVPLVPGVRQGTIYKRWGIIENTPLKEIFVEREVPDEDD